MDEPTAALDAAAAQAIERLIEHWRTEADGQRALVWVTHLPEQVQRMADRVLAMDQGRLTENP